MPKLEMKTGKFTAALKKLGETAKKAFSVAGAKLADWVKQLASGATATHSGVKLKRRNVLPLVAAAGVALTLALCAVPAMTRQTSGLNITHDETITADAIDAVTVDASFVSSSGTVLVHTDGRVDEGYLRSNLTTVPEQTFSVAKLTDRFFSVRLAEPPKNAFVLKLKDTNTSAYYKSFLIKYEPPEIGLRLKLVSESKLDLVNVFDPLLLMLSGDVPTQELIDKLEFSVPADVDIACTGSIAVITPKIPLRHDQRYKLTVTQGLTTTSGEKMRDSYYNEFTTRRVGLNSQGFVKDAGPFAQGNQELTVEFMDASSGQGPTGAVTLIFSEPISADTLRNYISVDPVMEYELQCKSNVAVFTPRVGAGQTVAVTDADGTEKMQQLDKYKLTVLEGMTSINGARLGVVQNKTVYLPSSARGAGVFKLALTNQSSNAIDVSKPIVLEFLLENSPVNSQLLEVSFYHVNNYEQYKKLLLSDKIEQDFGLARTSVHAEIIHEGLNTVELENPGKGTYLIKAGMIDAQSGDAVNIYKCVHVTDLSVYLQTADPQSAIWINSTATGQPAGGIKAIVSSTDGRVLAEGTTGTDGYAVLQYKDNDDAVWKKAMNEKRLLELRDAGGELLYADVTAVPSVHGEPEQYDLYYSMLFSDRTLYHPTDTICVWGFVKPYMLNQAQMPGEVRLTFDRDGTEQRTDVELLPNGTFSAEIGIERLVSSGYSVEAELLFPDGKTRGLGSIWLNVKEFEKPTFVLTTETESELYVAGDDITATAELKSYDGTPLPSYPLELTVFNLYDGNIQETRKLTTDTSGKVSFSFRPDAGAGKMNEGGPVECQYMITLANDGELLQKRGSYYYQSSEVLADSDFKVEGGRDFTLAVNTAKADASLITGAQQLDELINGRDSVDFYYDGGKGYIPIYRDDRKIFALLAGTPVDVGVRGEIAVDYITLSGAHKSESREFSLVTSGGAGTFGWELKEACDPSKTFARVKLSCVDDRLNQSDFGFGLGEKELQKEPEQKLQKGYAMSVTRQGESEPLKAELNYMGHEEITVRAGDLLNFDLMRDGAPAQNEGRLFWMLIQSRAISHSLSAEQTLELEIKPEHARSTLMCAAYFDGVDTYPIRDTMMRMEMESVNLDVSVTPDKDEYFPGDAVNLAVHVADEKGVPVKSSVCVSVVDESIFAISEQYVDVVESLYGELSFGGAWVTKYTTTIGDEPREPFFGDGGKGGDNLEAYDIIRENFKDTALFLPTVTDELGNASVSFELPDNTTSWRITTLSVGDSLYGGQGRDNIISTMPFYSKPVITPQYLEGDEVAVLMQGHGTALSEDSDIAYLLNITGNGVDKTIEASGKAYSPVLANLGKLAAGEYTVSATSRYQQMSDTVKRPLTVISSNLEMLVSREVDPKEISKINAQRFPLTLTLFDREHTAFYNSVSRLFTHFCDRADQRLSRYVAKHALSKYYDTSDIPRHIAESSDSVYYLQKNDGGIGWYREETESDPMLTAKVVLAVGTDPFSKPRLTKYLTEITQSHADGATRAAAYAALASIKPETVTEINRILVKGELPMLEKLYYIAGLAAGGDTARAKEIYERDASQFIKVSDSGKRMVYANDVQKDDELTAAAWIAASEIDIPDADSFSLYFSDGGWGISTIFECMIYVREYSKTVIPSGPITYTVNGVAKTISLGAAGQKSMTFLGGEFASLSFGEVPKNLTMMAYYVGEPEDADMKPSPNFTVQKTMKDEGDKGIRNTITVKFGADAPTGRYDLSDFVPSNMRFFSMIDPDAKKPQPYVYETQELQKLYFSLFRRIGDDSVTIEYYTRRTFEAKTLLDRVYMIHVETGETAFTERVECP